METQPQPFQSNMALAQSPPFAKDGSSKITTQVSKPAKNRDVTSNCSSRPFPATGSKLKADGTLDAKSNPSLDDANATEPDFKLSNELANEKQCQAALEQHQDHNAFLTRELTKTRILKGLLMIQLQRNQDKLEQQSKRIRDQDAQIHSLRKKLARR